MLNFVLLIISAACEAAWNIFLSKSRGFTDWSTNAIALFFLGAGIFTFKQALAGLPLSIAIVIWSGLALLFTVALDIYFFKTQINGKVAFFMALCILSILCLNYYHNKG